MLTDLRIVLPNRPGAVTTLCGALSDAGINVEGLCGDLRPGERWAYIHLAVEAGEETKRIIEEAGYEVTTTRPVHMVPITNEPGELARVLGEYSEKGLNVDVIYIASGNRLVVSTEDMIEHRFGVNIQDART